MARNSNKASSVKSEYLGLKLLLIAALFIGIFIASLQQRLPLFFILYYLLISLITYIAFALDKRAARRGRWRTSEQTLQLLSLLGGWPGALMGQYHLRHKSQKLSFRLGLWSMICANSALLTWLATSQKLQSIQAWFT
ncbi:DUF1294 domain-containing protein [Shewanella sp. Isolate11]|uniref:DUF1294 domain-containing protein n=1 Tax=Shewanella sp. Isolate11 TaxID=2908530 RepID=UPI001EFE39FF|nr:DUF1294 domain-containing protein [Shewanella sp. Isolate11]MCG9695861.1 DUF1294 domain-containing protein [Shewanella sp. Isolate11]